MAGGARRSCSLVRFPCEVPRMVFLEQGLRWRDPGRQAERHAHRPRGPRVWGFPLAARPCRRVTDGSSQACVLGGSALRFRQRGRAVQEHVHCRVPRGGLVVRHRAGGGLRQPSSRLFHRAPRAASKRREVALSRELESGRSCGHVQTPGSCWALSGRPDDAGGGPVEAPQLSPQYAPVSGEQPPPRPAAPRRDST